MADAVDSAPNKRGPSVGYFILFILRLGGLMPLTNWLLLIIAAAGWYAFELKAARPLMVWMGEPKAQDDSNPGTWTRTLRNRGYMLGYSDFRGNPLWVSYALAPIKAEPHPGKNADKLETDWRSINRVKPEDYHGSGYAPGLIAPAQALGLLHGPEARMETFLMTNVSPQKTVLNQKIWERLNDLELNYFAKQFGKLWVMAGPIFEPPTERIRGAWRVEIPDAFYKIYAAPEAKKMLAFVMPQNLHGDEPLEHFLTSVDSIERLTGLDFFRQLEDAEERRLEAAIEPDAWRLSELAHLPARRGHAHE